MDVSEDDTRVGARVTINDIARLAKVSKKTVSRVINASPHVREETREKINDIIRETGFIPDPQARALAFRRSFLVGLIYDNPSPQYVVSMQRGILDAIEGTSLQLVLQPVDRGDPDYLEKVRNFVLRQRPLGAILPPSVSEDERLAQLLRELDCDNVRIASVQLDEESRMIVSHDAEGAAQAARHLAELGHRVIAHVHGPKTFRSAHERLAGFKRGLADFGLDLAPELTLEGGYTFDSGVESGARLLALPRRPTAVFAGNDEMAMGIYVAVRKAGLSIPEDISIVGYDDTPVAARVWPPMTTVRSPIRETGKAAAFRLMQLSDGAGGPGLITFTPTLVVRESSSAPRN
jgi:LacI family transcriptional regulator